MTEPALPSRAGLNGSAYGAARGPAERAFLDKLLQVAGRRGPRCLADADVVFRAQAALEAVDALAEHAGNHFS